MDRGDGGVVGNQRLVEVAFRLGEGPLSLQDTVDRDGIGFVGGRNGFDLALGGDAAVEFSLAEHVVLVQVADGPGQLVREFEFRVLEYSPLFGQRELGVADAGHLAAESQRHVQLEAQLPFLELSVSQRLVGIGVGLREVGAGIAGLGNRSLPRPSQRYWASKSSFGRRKFLAAINSISRCLTRHFC